MANQSRKGAPCGGCEQLKAKLAKLEVIVYEQTQNVALWDMPDSPAMLRIQTALRRLHKEIER